jgi:hypothetical protein
MSQPGLPQARFLPAQRVPYAEVRNADYHRCSPVSLPEPGMPPLHLFGSAAHGDAVLPFFLAMPDCAVSDTGRRSNPVSPGALCVACRTGSDPACRDAAPAPVPMGGEALPGNNRRQRCPGYGIDGESRHRENRAFRTGGAVVPPPIPPSVWVAKRGATQFTCTLSTKGVRRFPSGPFFTSTEGVLHARRVQAAR